MNILGRDKGVVQAFLPAKGLDDKLIRNIQRYLEALRSTLLFARNVALVGGDAEEILIPAMVKKVLGVLCAWFAPPLCSSARSDEVCVARTVAKVSSDDIARS
jgi:hypothetical protein